MTTKDWFEYGDPVDLSKLPPDEAIAILGRPVFDALADMHVAARLHRYRVAKIDRTKGTVTLQFEESNG